MDLSKIKAEHSADPKLEVEGATLDFGDFQLRVARWGNPAFTLMLRRVMSHPDIKRKSELDRLSPEEDRALFDDVIAKTILVGWSNIEENGQTVPYSPEKARELLKMGLLREEVILFAKENANFKSRELADGLDALKKS